MVSPSTTRITLKVPETEAEIGLSGGDAKDVGEGVGAGVGTEGLLARPNAKLPKRSKKMLIPKTKFFFSIFTTKNTIPNLAPMVESCENLFH